MDFKLSDLVLRMTLEGRIIKVVCLNHGELLQPTLNHIGYGHNYFALTPLQFMLLSFDLSPWIIGLLCRGTVVTWTANSTVKPSSIATACRLV